MGYTQDCQVSLRVPADKAEAVAGIMREWLTERTYPMPATDETVISDGLVILLGEGGDIERYAATGDYVGDTYGKCSYDDSTILARLAAAGVTGTIEARGEDDSYWRWRLTGGKLLTYSGEIYYPTDPDAMNVVHVLTINHRHGQDTSVYASGEAAQAALVRYVDSNWDDECGRVNWIGSTERPDDETAMVQAYFAAMPDEWYSSTPVQVQP